MVKELERIKGKKNLYQWNFVPGNIYPLGPGTIVELGDNRFLGGKEREVVYAGRSHEKDIFFYEEQGRVFRFTSQDRRTLWYGEEDGPYFPVIIASLEKEVQEGTEKEHIIKTIRIHRIRQEEQRRKAA